MKQSIRALGWAVTISMILLLAFVATAFYCAYGMLITGQGIALGDLQASYSENGLVFSMPITVNNTGYYDMTELNVSTNLRDLDGAALASSSTEIREIKTGISESTLHNLSLSVKDILSNTTYLLFSDTELRLDLSIAFRYAYAFSFHVNLGNMSMPWGAPLYGLNLREAEPPSFNGTHLLMDITLDVENHSFLDMAADLDLRIYDQMGRHIGSGTALLHAPPLSRLSGPVEAVFEIENPMYLSDTGYLEAYLIIPMIDDSIELGRLDYG